MKTYATATSFRRALEDRLGAAAKSEAIDIQRMRRQVAFDRLLVRLFAQGNPPWCLKGGYALELKLAMARTTRDLDLGLSSGKLEADEVPKSIEPPPEFWSPVFAKLAAECEIDGDIGAQFEKLQKYWQAVSGDVA